MNDVAIHILRRERAIKAAELRTAEGLMRDAVAAATRTNSIVIGHKTKVEALRLIIDGLDEVLPPEPQPDITANTEGAPQ